MNVGHGKEEGAAIPIRASVSLLKTSRETGVELRVGSHANSGPPARSGRLSSSERAGAGLRTQRAVRAASSSVLTAVSSS